MYLDKEDGIPVVCPCCQATFYFPSGHIIHQKHQLDLFKPEITVEQVRELHPEVSEEPDEEC